MAILTLGDRFFGAVLGFQAASVLPSSGYAAPLMAECNAEGLPQVSEIQVSEMLLSYEPFAAHSSSPPSPSSPLAPWITFILHQQLSNHRFQSRQAAAQSPRHPSNHQSAIPRLHRPPNVLQLPWDSLCLGQSWSLSFMLLTQELQEQSLAKYLQPPTDGDKHSFNLYLSSLLGLWLGATYGPSTVPLNHLSSKRIVTAKEQANRLYLAWAGHHEFGKVSVS